MKQPGFNRHSIHSHLGQNFCHGYRMRHVGLAGSAELPLVKRLCKQKRLFDGREVVVRAIRNHTGAQILKRLFNRRHADDYDSGFSEGWREGCHSSIL